MKYFPLYSEKAQQVLASFLKLSRNHEDKYKAVKLMYLFEREMLLRTGLPSLSGRLCSILHGPIISEVNDYINYTNVDNIVCEENSWYKNFSLVGNRIELCSTDISNDLLSEFEDDLIVELHNKFRQSTFGQLKRYMHNLPESVETTSCEDISYKEFFLKNNYSLDEVKELLNDIEYHLLLTQSNKEYAR